MTETLRSPEQPNHNPSIQSKLSERDIGIIYDEDNEIITATVKHGINSYAITFNLENGIIKKIGVENNNNTGQVEVNPENTFHVILGFRYQLERIFLEYMYQMLGTTQQSITERDIDFPEDEDEETLRVAIVQILRNFNFDASSRTRNATPIDIYNEMVRSGEQTEKVVLSHIFKRIIDDVIAQRQDSLSQNGTVSIEIPITKIGKLLREFSHGPNGSILASGRGLSDLWVLETDILPQTTNSGNQHTDTVTALVKVKPNPNYKDIIRHFLVHTKYNIEGDEDLSTRLEVLLKKCNSIIEILEGQENLSELLTQILQLIDEGIKSIHELITQNQTDIQNAFIVHSLIVFAQRFLYIKSIIVVNNRLPSSSDSDKNKPTPHEVGRARPPVSACPANNIRIGDSNVYREEIERIIESESREIMPIYSQYEIQIGFLSAEPQASEQPQQPENIQGNDGDLIIIITIKRKAPNS